MLTKTLHVTYPEPHRLRAKEILKAHPEIKSLLGANRWSALCVLGIVLAQFVIAYFIRDQSFWILLISAWAVGAVFNHALFVLIHEATHNLIFVGTRASKIISIIANLPLVFPVALGFRRFHLLHHQHLGEHDFDADLAGPVEAARVGNSWWRKMIWLFIFGFIEGTTRPARLKKVRFMNEPWIWFNAVCCIALSVAVFLIFGFSALTYLALSTVFSVGLHPLGARWIQEHHVVAAPQETYSYYGSFNYVMFNVGYHNEHHDLLTLPWNHLPKLRKIAPEFYENLVAHESYWKLLAKFIFSPSITLYSRVTR